MNKKFKILILFVVVYVVVVIIIFVVFVFFINNLDKFRLEKFNDFINFFGDFKNIELKDDIEKVEKFFNIEFLISDINGFILKSVINILNMIFINSVIN